MGQTTEDMPSWMSMPADEWAQSRHAVSFYCFIKNLPVINDTAERYIGLLKDKIKNFHKEDLLQSSLITIAEERKQSKAAKNGTMNKRTLKTLVRNVVN